MAVAIFRRHGFTLAGGYIRCGLFSFLFRARGGRYGHDIPAPGWEVRRAPSVAVSYAILAQAALVSRVSSGRLVRRLSPVPRRPLYSYNAEDLLDQPHFSQYLHFLSTRTRIFPRRMASYRSLERSPSGTLAGPYCGGYGAIFFH